MKKPYLLAAVLVVLVVVFILGFLVLRNGKGTSPANTTATTTDVFSTSIDTTPTGTSTTTSGAVLVPTTDGGTIQARDFIHNGTTVKDPQNQGTYYLAGDLGYCNPDGSCPSGATSTEFNILYNTTDSSFTIALIDEPIGTVRRHAEQFLQQTLGITPNDMCKLNYQVLTSVGVNATYAGRDLRFSFCSGAVHLP